MIVSMEITCVPTCKKIAKAPKIKCGKSKIDFLSALATAKSSDSLSVSISGSGESLTSKPKINNTVPTTA